jgi:hypothetical protein
MYSQSDINVIEWKQQMVAFQSLKSHYFSRRYYQYNMPSLSAFLGNKPVQAPCIHFYGPDAQHNFTAIDPSGRLLAQFSVANNMIWRISQNAQQICAFKRSSLSGTTTLQLHGQEIKVKQSWEGMRYGKDIKISTGTWKWRPGSGSCEELKDGGGVLLARGKLPGTLSKKIYPLEVFVSGDVFTLDLILASWVAMLDCQDAEGKEGKAIAEVVGAVLGA